MMKKTGWTEVHSLENKYIVSLDKLSSCNLTQFNLQK